jgi:hypothetical protein
MGAAAAGAAAANVAGDGSTARAAAPGASEAAAAGSATGATREGGPVGVDPLGSNRHLFIDDWLTERKKDVQLAVNPPENRQLVLTADQPWERAGISNYCNVFWDAQAGEYRLYYTPLCLESKPIFRLALATSKDGIHWDKPELGAVEWNGSRKNNIVIDGEREGTVFIDPNAPPERRYGYLSGIETGIFYYSSADGIHFRKAAEPVSPHQSDSQISTFWDDQRKKYCHYFKIMGGSGGKWNMAGDVSVNANIPFPQDEPLGRTVARCETERVDQKWTGPYGIVMARDPRDPPDMDLYTNAAHKYQLAPDVYVAFPTPYYHYFAPGREYLNEPAMKLGGKHNDGAIETQLAISRDGITWTRYRAPYYPMWHYDESLYLQVVMGFPGLVYKPNRIEQYFSGYNFTHGDTNARVRLTGRELGGVFRSTQRIDGFVSADFAYGGGTLLTRPFTFRGERLVLNVSTSAAGEGRVALVDEAGADIAGFGARDCRIINGDFLDKTVQWTGGNSDVSHLAGKAIRLRFELRGAKLYSFRFEESRA